jgi:hypothetical protein
MPALTAQEIVLSCWEGIDLAFPNEAVAERVKMCAEAMKGNAGTNRVETLVTAFTRHTSYFSIDDPTAVSEIEQSLRMHPLIKKCPLPTYVSVKYTDDLLRVRWGLEKCILECRAEGIRVHIPPRERKPDTRVWVKVDLGV